MKRLLLTLTILAVAGCSKIEAELDRLLNRLDKQEQPPVVVEQPQAPIPPVVLPEPQPSIPQPHPIEKYLWKPKSDSDGKLAVLFRVGVEKCKVKFNGQDVSQRNVGPGNERDNQIRFPKTGCEYGSPVVTVWCDGVQVKTKDGKEIRGAGCNRQELYRW